MGLLDIFQKKIDTGLVLEIKPVMSEEVIRYSETNILGRSWSPGFPSAIEAAYFSNLFAGDYSVYYGKRDDGHKPILVQSKIGEYRKIIPAKIVLPTEQESYHFSYPQRFTNQDWFNMFLTEFTHEEKNYRCRVYCSPKKRKTVFQAIQETKLKPFTNLTDFYDLRLYDVSLAKSIERNFSFTRRGWVDKDGRLVEE